MQGLILAGGKGTRLRPLTVHTPKPVVLVANRPFLLYQIEFLRSAGIREITLSLSYLPEKIVQLLGDGSDYAVKLTYVTEPSPMGTAGAYRYAVGDIKDTTVVLNGDILTDVRLSKIIEFHNNRKAAATISLRSVPNPEIYGLVETGDDESVKRFIEKPKPEELSRLTTDKINAGIYILEPEILDLIPVGENRSFEYDVFPQILSSKLPFYAFDLRDKYWRDIGNPKSYLEANMDILAGVLRVEFSVQENLIAPDCTIKPGASVTNSVLGVGVHVEEKTVIENSVVWPHTRIAAGSHVSGAVIGRGCHVGRNVTIKPGAVLGDKASIPDHSHF
ncbi:MAG: NDP-sugar synthase [Blastocatellia bacterium]|nr:NDP-sugar synthase [Blastocatellia bacterium]